MGHEDMPAWRASAQYALAAAVLMRSRIDTALSEGVGHSLAENEALANLREAGRPLRMGEIADRIILSPGGTTKLIDRLEAAGYVARTPDPDDRRVTTVELTASGGEALEQARPVVIDTMWQVWGRHLEVADADALVSALRRITAGNGWLD